MGLIHISDALQQAIKDIQSNAAGNPQAEIEFDEVPPEVVYLDAHEFQTQFEEPPKPDHAEKINRTLEHKPDHTEKINRTLEHTQLNHKAVQVQLTIRRPATLKRDRSAEAYTQNGLDDTGLKVSKSIFVERTNPIRELLNLDAGLRKFHAWASVPYIDRGPRLCPVERYEFYRDEMRTRIGEIDRAASRIRPQYAALVAQDMATRGGRAKIDDYPTDEQFFGAMTRELRMMPLPETNHPLFDISPEDKAAFVQQLAETADDIRADLVARIQVPVRRLAETLAIPHGAKDADGKRTGGFKESSVTNIVCAIAQARNLAMGDPEVLAAADEASTVIKPIASNNDLVRDDEHVRAAKAAELKALSDKLSFMFS